MKERKKIYPSYQDLHPREYMYFPKGTLDAGKPGSFSRIELLHLLIAIGVLIIAFSFTLSGNSLLFGFQSIDSYLAAVPIAFLGLVTAFFVHELAHKFIAQKYGLWSEFRMYPQGLLLSLILAFFTSFVFAAPGAVMFRGDTRTFETGRIAAAGPTANIIIGGISYVLYRFVFFEMDFVGRIFGFVSLVNVLLATFNLLPFGPLDGIKVIRWNGIVWSVLFAFSVVLLAFIFLRGILLPGF